jgi:1-acyl-sn-glycerol-3-phosphate acyltransferase
MRLRLLALLIVQLARVMADWCLRLVAVLFVAGPDRQGVLGSWHLATAVATAPFLVLAPFNGCFNNSLPRRLVLIVVSAFTLAVVVACVWFQFSWLVCLGLVAVGAGVSSPTRYALIPAAAQDTGVPLTRVNGLMEMAGVGAIICGLMLALKLLDPDWPANGQPLTSAVAWALIGLNLVCLVAAFGVSFPSDVPRPEPFFQSVAGFFRDCKRIALVPLARGNLLALACFQALVTAGAGVVAAPLLSHESGQTGDQISKLIGTLGLVAIGTAVGCLLAAFQGHPRRNPGLVPFGATGLVVALLLGQRLLEKEPHLASQGLPAYLCVLLGISGGLVNVPLRAAYIAAVPADARGNAMSVMNFAIYFCTTVLSLLMAWLSKTPWLNSPGAQLGFLAVPAFLGALLAWRLLYPAAIEQVVEIMLLPIYRFHLHGPGKGKIPMQGPLLIVANHSAYMDPFWVAKVVQRRVTPMMTSLFYDLPFVHWMMVHVVGAIRVPHSTFRREAPELRDAVEVLRQAGCVLLFPEGRLRRTTEQLISPFGQGIWHILKEMPETPVVVCWIEGGWGSFTSYKGGPPMKNKRPRLWRHINLAFAEPQVLPAELLADRDALRAYLMRACLECRRYLGLEVPALPTAEQPAPIDSGPGTAEKTTQV